jgi:hypothetical protein
MSQTLDFKLIFDSNQLQPSVLEKCVLSFEEELLELGGVESILDNHEVKEIDPMIFATLSLSLAPIVATKFFEFLNTWLLRRENRLVKIKIQIGKDKSIEFEGSETMSKKDVEAWILAIETALKSKR